VPGPSRPQAAHGVGRLAEARDALPDEAVAFVAKDGARIQQMFFSDLADPYVPMPVEQQK
jgi:hypothetical protein